MRGSLFAFAFGIYVYIFFVWSNLLLPKNDIDPELAPYYNAFLTAVKNDCYSDEYNNPSHVVVKFNELPGTTVGRCSTGPFGYKIQIDKNYWNLSSEANKYQLVFHESIHCVLNRDHVNNEDDIMYPYMRDFPIFKTFYQAEQYIKSDCTLWRNNDHAFRYIEK